METQAVSNDQILLCAISAYLFCVFMIPYLWEQTFITKEDLEKKDDEIDPSP